MRTSVLTEKEKGRYNKLIGQPLQSWEWGEFRKKTGVKVERIGFWEGEKLMAGLQVTFHKIPHTPFTVGYLPKGPLPTQEHINALTEIGKKHNAIFIQLEPNVIKTENLKLKTENLRTSSRPLFTKYTFHLDLTPPEEQLLKNMHPKTRYNIRVAQKHGVKIQEENTEEAFNAYLALTAETTKRQGFYAHTPKYHQLMWESLQPTGMAHLLTARYQGKILVTWILFLFNDVLYYPYGASTQQYKEVMASNLMMWEAIRFGKSKGAKLFDLWGTPGPDPKPTDPYFGFHRFKLGYGPKLVEFIGSYDLVLKPLHYQLFTLVNKLRWLALKAKAG